MKIVLSGYGRMGREIEKMAAERSHQIIAIVDNPADWIVKEDVISGADAVIDFTTPGSVLGNIRRCFDLNLPFVTGTTGWNEHHALAREWCDEEQQSIFVASNFSLGVNLLFALTKKLAAMMNQVPGFDISLEEVHHVHKLDAPSGTAIRLAELILSISNEKNTWVNRPSENEHELEILSKREGEVTGKHLVKCASRCDILTLSHEALDRQGFAAGALMAAEWLPGKKGWYGMEDLLHW